MSLYSEYVKEREGIETIEFAEGFITYKYDLNSCNILDAYVQPEHRKLGIVGQLLKVVEEKTKEQGYTDVYCTVCPSTNNSTDSLKVILNLGFKLNSATSNLIILKKELQ